MKFNYSYTSKTSILYCLLLFKWPKKYIIYLACQEVGFKPKLHKSWILIALAHTLIALAHTLIALAHTFIAFRCTILFIYTTVQFQETQQTAIFFSPKFLLKIRKGKKNVSLILKGEGVTKTNRMNYTPQLLFVV